MTQNTKEMTLEKLIEEAENTVALERARVNLAIAVARLASLKNQAEVTKSGIIHVESHNIHTS